MSHFAEIPGSWLTFLNASQQVRTSEKSGVSLSGKAVAYGINLIAVVHHYYPSPTAEKRNAIAMKTNGGEDPSWNKMKQRRRTSHSQWKRGDKHKYNQDHSQKKKKKKNRWDSHRGFESNDLTKMQLWKPTHLNKEKTFFNHTMHNEEKGKNNSGE